MTTTDVVTTNLDAALKLTSQRANQRVAAVWSQDNCKWCVKVKDLLERNGFKVVIFDVAMLPAEQRSAFKTAHKTVPQVFLHGEHVGGYQETRAYLAKTAQSNAINQAMDALAHGELSVLDRGLLVDFNG